MGRTIKLLLYYFAYQLAFMGVFLCGYVKCFHHTAEMHLNLLDSTYCHPCLTGTGSIYSRCRYPSDRKICTTRPKDLGVL